MLGPLLFNEVSVFDGPEKDRLALRELLDRYSDAVNRRDADAWSTCWAEDATWIFRGSATTGRTAIVANWRAAMDGFESVWFSAFPGAMLITDAVAVMTTHTFEYLVPVGGKPRLQSGLYHDRAVNDAGQWVFTQRDFTPKEMPL